VNLLLCAAEFSTIVAVLQVDFNSNWVLLKGLASARKVFTCRMQEKSERIGKRRFLLAVRNFPVARAIDDAAFQSEAGR
jgi:hypothetical protein